MSKQQEYQDLMDYLERIYGKEQIDRFVEYANMAQDDVKIIDIKRQICSLIW